MSGRHSTRFAKWLVREKAIPEADEELYAFAAFSFVFEMIPFIITLSLGLIFSMLLESVLIIIPLISIRKFGGGYHLDAAWKCIAISTLFLITIMFLLRSVILIRATVFLTCATTISSVCICIFSPIDCEARKLSEIEKRLFQKIVIGIVIACLFVYVSLIYCNKFQIAAPIGMGVVSAGVLQMPCIIKRMVSYIRNH